MTTDDQLWKDYNNYRFRTARVTQLANKGVNPRSLAPKKFRMDALDAMKTWCVEKGIDPRHWLYSLFVARRWVWAPRFDHLISPKHLVKYPKLQTGNLYDQLLREQDHAKREADGRTYDPNRDMSATTEAHKQALLDTGNADACMSKLDELFGFHPGSEVCGSCPLATQCQGRLQAAVDFDIMALRRGEITTEQAKVMVAYRG